MKKLFTILLVSLFCIPAVYAGGMGISSDKKEIRYHIVVGKKGRPAKDSQSSMQSAIRNGLCPTDAKETVGAAFKELGARAQWEPLQEYADVIVYFYPTDKVLKLCKGKASGCYDAGNLHIYVPYLEYCAVEITDKQGHSADVRVADMLSAQIKVFLGKTKVYNR